MAKEFIFDMPHATRFVDARQAFLREHLPGLQKTLGLATALDAGCGVGYFSKFLAEMGFQVTAVDGREENIEEARRRHSSVVFQAANVEDPRIQELGSFDFVLCFGLLYHLENPFRAVRNLAAMTCKFLLLESICLPEKSPFLYFRDEPPQEDQALHSVACYPSEGALIKMFYRAEFPFVYRPLTLPDHEDFRATMERKRLRTMLAASRVALQNPLFVPMVEPANGSDPWDNMPAKVKNLVARARHRVHRIRAK